MESPPLVTTNGPADVTTSSAKLNGTVNPNGLQTFPWFEWGTDNNLVGCSTTDNSLSIGNGVSNSPWNATIPVSAGGTYYYRIVASNPEGSSRGDIVQFRAYQLPDAITAAATSITLNGADLIGTVNPNGFETFAWFEYGLDPSMSNPNTTDNQLIGSGTTSVPILKNIPGLTPYTTWYFRVVARNAGGTRKGAIKNFPTGDYFVAFGDSITFGQGDDYPPDDTSLDGRNTGGGFEPILNNLLTAAESIPHNIANEGVGGTSSMDGAGTISSVLSNHPNAKYYLVQYGTNDASIFRPPVPSGLGLNPGNPGYSGSYKDNMQRIISAIIAAGKSPYLAKVPYTTLSRYDIPSIQEYNAVIDELVAANSISVVPPDFYSWFQAHTSQLADGLHPNGIGYQSMANLWFSALTLP